MAAVLATTLLGCSGRGDPAEPRSGEATTAATPAGVPSLEAQTVEVPDVLRQPVRVARKAIQDLGLRVRIHPSPTACPPHGRVISQRPRRGEAMETDRVVDLWVTRRDADECGLGLPAARPQLRRVAEKFLAFARGHDADAVPLAGQVTLLLGNQPVATIRGAVAQRRATWAVCPGEGIYTARTCPFSAVRPFRTSYLGPIAITSAAPSDPCTHPPPVPPRLRSLDFVTLTPDEPRSCFDYFAVQLFMEGGRIVAANLIWAEP